MMRLDKMLAHCGYGSRKEVKEYIRKGYVLVNGEVITDDDYKVVANCRWKLSEHAEGAGAVVGGLVAFSALFGYNPIWWLSGMILVAGIVGTARIILGHHTVGEVLGGFAVGWLCAMLVLNPMTNLLFRILII